MVCCYLSYTYVWAAEFPGGAGVGSALARGADAVTTWAQDNLTTATAALKNAVTVVTPGGVPASGAPALVSAMFPKADRSSAH